MPNGWLTGPMQLPFITGDEIRSRLDILGLVEAMRQGHRQPAPVMERVLMAEPGTDNSFLVWHAWAPGSMIAVKMGTIFPGNPSLPEPRPAVQAVITAFDGVDGTPVALIDGTELTYWKTAASSALAADFLARPDAATLLMVGAGGLAPYLAMAHRAVRPSIDRVLVWNRSRHKAERMADAIGGEVVDDLDAAVGRADVVCAATAATEPLIHGAVVRPGTHLDLVGGFTPRCARATTRWPARHACSWTPPCSTSITAATCANRSPRVCGAATTWRRTCSGCAGANTRDEPPDDDITLYKSGGGAHLDLMATRYAMETLT
jgi:ornithine cyclodeaminase/alanine dehydrogenase-like protein (mu-crystallin family)